MDNIEHYRLLKIVLIISAFLILLNLLILDLKVINVRQTPIIKPAASEIPAPIPAQDLVVPQTCPVSCLSQIEEATKSLNLKDQALSAKITTQTASQTKEFFIPFGSGSSSSGDWEDVPGLQAYVDTTSYGNIKSAVFEASIHIPTGNESAGVRLFNATDKHPVWFSEMLYSGGSDAQMLSSQNLSLDEGSKLYKVQMKTQLQYPAVLDQSRLHIVTH